MHVIIIYYQCQTHTHTQNQGAMTSALNLLMKQGRLTAFINEDVVMQAGRCKLKEVYSNLGPHSSFCKLIKYHAQ